MVGLSGSSVYSRTSLHPASSMWLPPNRHCICMHAREGRAQKTPLLLPCQTRRRGRAGRRGSWRALKEEGKSIIRAAGEKRKADDTTYRADRRYSCLICNTSASRSNALKLRAWWRTHHLLQRKRRKGQKKTLREEKEKKRGEKAGLRPNCSTAAVFSLVAGRASVKGCMNSMCVFTHLSPPSLYLSIKLCTSTLLRAHASVLQALASRLAPHLGVYPFSHVPGTGGGWTREPPACHPQPLESLHIWDLKA